MDIKETNVANIGSKMDHDLREKAAATEIVWSILENPQEGLKIWRIEKFKVVAIDVKSYGTFYNGDSYIILKTIKNNKEFTYNLHFWIGSNSSQDEYGTAAYKAVELDDLLSKKVRPHLYRETELAMSDIFRSYFPQGLTILEGGVETGFKHIPYNPQDMFFNNFSSLLYKIHNNTTKIIPLCSNLLNEEDSYIIDTGKVIYIYNGKSASHSEIYQCNNLAQNIRNSRTVIKTQIQQRFDLEELKNDKSIFKDSNNNSILVEHINIPDEICNTKIVDFTPYISALTLTTINNKTLNGNDSYIISHNNIKYIWIGKESNNMESKIAWNLAVRHLPLDTQVSIEREGNESLIFKSLFL